MQRQSRFIDIGWMILSIRFVQGWIFWGGGSRRFIYDPEKLNPYAPQWMANKLQSAMPGSLFDLKLVVSFFLEHFIVLYIAILAFSLIELLSGLGLILGFCTRAAAMLTTFISLVLMLLFGWQGSTCMDEWTMAVATLAMGLTLVLTGSSVYSVDAWLLRTYPKMGQNRGFLCFNSGSWSFKNSKILALTFFIFTLIFTVGTYDYYRGSVYSRYHAGPVNPDMFHLSLTDGRLDANGAIRFNIAVDAGPSAVPNYIMRIELIDQNKNIIEIWSASNLRNLEKTAIQNTFAYNKIAVGKYGLIAPESAKAGLFLTPNHELHLAVGFYTLLLYTIDGKRWELRLNVPKKIKD